MRTSAVRLVPALLFVLALSMWTYYAHTRQLIEQRLTSSGHASKEQVQRMVLRLTGLASTDGMKLDETDAIALALAGLHQTSTVGGGLAVGNRTAHGPAALRQLVTDLRQGRDVDADHR